MKVEDLLDRRRQQWYRLENLCNEIGSPNKFRNWPVQQVLEFSDLYRSACTDLALARSHKLPPATVDYLHNLVGRAHNQLYRSRKYQYHEWLDTIFRVAPRRIYRDRCVQVCAVLFFGLFFLSGFLAWNRNLFPEFAETVVGKQGLEELENNFAEDISRGDSFSGYAARASFYIQHNTGIGLQCFALGPLIVPTLFALAYNAVVLGASFGFMARTDIASGDNFFEFVTAHGPFELTAIVLSAAAGLRLGVGLFATAGLTRGASLRVQAANALPIIVAASLLFFLAAFTEGLLSPSPAPYAVKAAWAVISSTALMFYFVVLGYPSEDENAV